jgi:hypothetical protein
MIKIVVYVNVKVNYLLVVDCIARNATGISYNACCTGRALIKITTKKHFDFIEETIKYFELAVLF